MTEESGALAAPSRQRTAFVNVAFNYAIIALVLLQGFVLTPLYLHYIPVQLYGAWLATGNVLAWVELVDPGMATLLQQRVAFAFGRRDSRELATVIGSGLLLVTLFSALPLLAIPFAGGIASLVNLSGAQDRELVMAFQLGLVSLTLTLASNSIGGVNTGLQRTGVSGVIGLVGALGGVVASLALLLNGAQLSSIPGGFLTRGLFVLLANGVALRLWCRRHLPEGLRVSHKEAAAVLHLSTFSLVARLGATLLQRFDSFFSARLVSPTAAAVFTLTGRSFDIVRMASDRIGGGLLPPLAHLAGEGVTGRVREVVMQMVAVTAWISAIGLALVVAFNGLFVRLWVGSDLYGGDALTVAAAASTAVTIQAVLFGQLVYGLGAVRACSLVVLAEAVIRLPLQVLFVRGFGLIGLPLATVVTSLSISLVLLPLIAERIVRSRPTELLTLVWRRLAFVAVVTALGVALRYALVRAPFAWTWASFAAAILVSGLGLLGIVVAIDSGLRIALHRTYARAKGKFAEKRSR